MSCFLEFIWGIFEGFLGVYKKDFCVIGFIWSCWILFNVGVGEWRVI